MGGMGDEEWRQGVADIEREQNNVWTEEPDQARLAVPAGALVQGRGCGAADGEIGFGKVFGEKCEEVAVC